MKCFITMAFTYAHSNVFKKLDKAIGSFFREGTTIQKLFIKNIAFL